MSTLLETAQAALTEKFAGADFDSTAKFVVDGEGSLFVENNEVRVGDDEADVTLTADADTFREMFDGELDGTAAFMSGRLKIDGNMGLAMQLSSILS